MSKNKIIWHGGLDVNAHYVTWIHADSQSDIVTVVIERGKNVRQVEISMEHAAEIGLINIKALDKYL